MLLSEKMKLVIKSKLDNQFFDDPPFKVEQNDDGNWYLVSPDDPLKMLDNYRLIPKSELDKVRANIARVNSIFRERHLCPDFSVLSSEIVLGGIAFVVVLDSGEVHHVKITNQDLAEYQLPESS